MSLEHTSRRDDLTATGAVGPPLSTGVEILDRKLDGGVPPGSIVALSAAPASQSELFLYELTGASRTLYLTTKRTAGEVRAVLMRNDVDDHETAVRELGTPASLDRAMRLVESLPKKVNVVIDPMDALEHGDRSRLEDFLNGLRSRLRTTGSLAVLHCLDGSRIPTHRDTTEYMADVVFRLETAVSRESVVNRLTIPKFRGGHPPREVIKLELGESVSVDISRDIG